MVSQHRKRKTSDFTSYSNRPKIKKNLIMKKEKIIDNFTNTEVINKVVYDKRTEAKRDKSRTAFSVDDPENFLDSNNDKKDFYEYNEECFKRSQKVVIPSKEEISEKLVFLPFLSEMRRQNKRLVVWDLDETLIHCIKEKEEDLNKADIQLEIKFTPMVTKKVLFFY